ncbi:MAG: 3-hydroxyacyl-CoA dehydrogenase NAD-binding domain-containing protein [Caulobacterales bacterium]|nr:3-hydroxyacyl-CoA dehydrogenase NAD-binding domain-containing protein [Caulobacterales bacterium]
MKSVALVGVGQIGRGWAPIFANAGYRVRLFDSADADAGVALDVIRDGLADMQREGMIVSADEAAARIEPAGTLEEACADAVFVQESVPERTEIKNRVFKEIDAVAPADTPIASSCSSLPPDTFLEDVPGRARCLIAHPCTPPHLIPVVELLPSSWTSPKVMDAAWELFEEIGQEPVLVRKPVFGYAINRLHAVLCREAVWLVENGIMSPKDVDACIKYGIGLRWGFMGPLETMDLNSNAGFKEYTDKFWRVYDGVGKSIDYSRLWTDEAIAEIDAWRREECPAPDDIERRRRWRDRCLMRMAKLFRPVGPWAFQSKSGET